VLAIPLSGGLLACQAFRRLAALSQGHCHQNRAVCMHDPSLILRPNGILLVH